MSCEPLSGLADADKGDALTLCSPRLSPFFKGDEGEARRG